MTKTKLIGLVAVGVGLLVASLATAQTYNPYTYQFPTYQYQAPQYGSGACPAIYSNLLRGARGTQVNELQRFLLSRYNDTRLAGGYFGQLTHTYVQRFQRENGISPTGGVGPQTRAAIMRACGGITPGPMYRNPTPSQATFRLDKSFTLRIGQSAQEYRGSLTVTLNQIDGGYSWPYYYSANPDSARVTLAFNCAPGTYCLYAPQQSFTIDEDDSVEFMGYEVELTNLDNDRATFKVNDDDRDDDDDATIDVTDPTTNEDFEQGDEMRIAWTVRDEPSNASVVLDLYTENDRFVGTIAIEDGESGSYEWDVPEGGEFCTLQYPNGLCGRDLDGDFYIKARLVAGNGFNAGLEYDSDKSGVFTIED